MAYLQPALPINSQYVQVGHPHYTTYPGGKPKLLVACFRDAWSARPETGREGYRHEIHAICLDSVNIFDPRTYGVARDVAVSPERRRMSKWYDVSEAERLVLLVTGHDVAKVRIDEAASIASVNRSRLRHYIP